MRQLRSGEHRSRLQVVVLSFRRWVLEKERVLWQMCYLVNELGHALVLYLLFDLALQDQCLVYYSLGSSVIRFDFCLIDFHDRNVPHEG